MTNQARQYRVRVPPQTLRRVDRQPPQASERPAPQTQQAAQVPQTEAPERGLSPTAVSALMAPDAALQPGMSNGQIASDLDGLPASRVDPIAAGNGVLLAQSQAVLVREPDESAAPVPPQRTTVIRGELEAEAAAQDAAVEQVAEEEAAIEMEPEVIEMEPEVIEARAPPRPRGGGGGGGGGGGDPRVVVQRWQGSVTQAGSGMPRPTMDAVSGGPGQITEAAEEANTAQEGVQEGLPEEAAANIEEPPELEDPPAPPESDPVPEHTSAILEASDKRLPEAQLPVFTQTPVRDVLNGQQVGGNWPQLGQRPVPNNIFELALSPEREELAEIPADEADRDRRELEHFRQVLAEPLQAGEQMGEGAAAPLVDTGPERMPPLPESMATPVAAVVARLLASMDTATTDVMRLLRKIAYPGTKLSKYYPDLGDVALKGPIRERMGTDLREIAISAGVTGEQLDGMVDERKRELEQQVAACQEEISTAHEEATENVGETGQETLNTIEGVRQATDEEIISRQEEASGGNDPTVVNARRDLVIRWIRNHVTTQTTNYQKAGEKREGELGTGQQQRIDAYNALAQREEYQAMHPAPPREPHDRTQPEVARTLSDLGAAIRAWTRDRIREVRQFVSPFLVSARDETRANRAAVEAAGNEGISAARIWAEDRILEGQSWWERFKATLGRWFGDSQEANEQWSVRRTEETRDAIASDVTNIAGIQAAVAQGATREELLQSEGLTEEQKSIVNEYFEQPPGTHPLDFAGALLRRRVANQYLGIARPAFETELLGKPDEDYPQLTDIARTNNGDFNAEEISRTVHAQLDNFDSDEAAILESLEGLSGFEGAIVRKAYRAMWGRDLDAELAMTLDWGEQDQAQLRLEGNQVAADVEALEYAMGTFNTDEKAVMDLLRGKTPEQIEAIRAEYRRRYNRELDDALEAGLDEGNEQDQAAALVSGDTETADAIAIDEAMRGGTGWGTDEEDIEATYKRVHDEVLVMARNEGWSSEQFQAEVRRRTQGIEARFGERYADVEEYNEPGTEGKTVLRRAVSSEMWPGPERDLANALASNDQIAADAARIEIERRGVWASDDAINNVLTNQYERALEETRLDHGPARQARIDRRRRELLEQDPGMDENELSIGIMALERQIEGEMADEAQERSHISMQALEQAYKGNYFYPLSYTLAFSMDGTELEKARALQLQGGRLTALQAVEFATEDWGYTDEDALRTRIGSMTKAEIDDLRREWEAAHPGESFDDMLREELGGRDESDVMDMVEHGAPESAAERIDQERRRMERELGELSGPLGGLAAGREADIIRRNMERLEELEPDLFRRDLSPEERREIRDDLDYRIELVQQAVEDHRRAIDSVANLAAQVASMVVAITVGAVLTAVTGGALGPVMIAVIASVAATLTTIATKQLIQGGSYSGEDMGVDLAIGVVDALTAAATAGMGGRILHGAMGAAQQAAKPTRLTRALGGLAETSIAQRVARSRAGQVVGSAASRANRAQSGFLTRGIQGENILARMAAPERSRAMRILGNGLAEGIEDAAGALPSAFVGTALNDQTWEGDPLSNLFIGTVTGVGMGVAMGAGFRGASAAGSRVASDIRLSTPEGRIREANRVMGDAFQRHLADNPQASYRDFLDSPAGQRASAEVEQRGLMRDVPEAPEARADEGMPDVEAAPARVDEAAPTRAEDVLPLRPEEAAPRVGDEVPGTPEIAASAPAPRGDAAVPGSEARFTPEPAAPRTEAPLPHSDAPAGAAPGPATKVEAPDAEAAAARTGEAPDGAPSRSPATDPASQALRDGLPKALTDRVDIRVNPELEGNTVRVVPDPHGGPRRGVRVEAGPDATPTDVLLHSHTVQSMQRYRGILGRLRQLRDWFNLTSVGSRGWEAKLEMEKLPGLVHERMRQLAKGDLDIETQARLLDEINSLSRQIDAHQRILESPELRDEPGRGFVAGRGKKKKGRRIASMKNKGVKRAPDELRAADLTIINNSILGRDGGIVYQIGHEWQETGDWRVYRRVLVHDANGKISHVQEEIQLLDASRNPNGKWVKRGSESSSKTGEGRVGELASQETVKGGEFEGITDAAGKMDSPAARKAQQEAAGKDRVAIREDALKSKSDNGFDGAFLRFDPGGKVTFVVIEAKSQPSGLGLGDFSAVKGKQFHENLKNLIDDIRNKTPEELGFKDDAQRLQALDALTGPDRRIEIQVHTAHGTKLGSPTSNKNILRKLKILANIGRGSAKQIEVRHVPLTKTATDDARKIVQSRDLIGEPSVRPAQLAGPDVPIGSPEYRQAESMFRAEGRHTHGAVRRTPDGNFIDESGVIFDVVGPQQAGAVPKAADIAADVISRLKQPPPGKRRVILNLHGLPKKVRLDVLQILADEQRARKLLTNILVHDPVDNSMDHFDPDDVK